MLNKEFIESVRFNCNVSDAKYWGFFSICSLLLRLRELFKVEENLEPWESIDKEKIYEWIEKKEEIWKLLENEEFRTLKINGTLFEPFEAEKINKIISRQGYVYGAGHALFMKPSFFIGIIRSYQEIDGYKVYLVEREIVRDIFSSPGMSIEKTIFIRRSDIKFRLWDHLNDWLNKKGNIYDYLISTFQHPSKWKYPFEEFNKILDKYCKLVLYHEISEQEESVSDWRDIIRKCQSSKTEHILRSIQDFIADLAEKGPIKKAILEHDKELICLYLASRGPYQRKIFKNSLYQLEKAVIEEDWDEVDNLRVSNLNHWKNYYIKIMDIFRADDYEKAKRITDKIFNGGWN